VLLFVCVCVLCVVCFSELAHALAEMLFGDRSALLRVDMGGFKARGDISTLVGAPKGYQDSKDGGALTNFLSRLGDGGGVVLLDEVEKAHPEVSGSLSDVLPGVGALLGLRLVCLCACVLGVWVPRSRGRRCARALVCTNTSL
jgi:hypothetical protein